MNQSTIPAEKNEIPTTVATADVIQKHLQQLEIMAKHVHLSLEQMVELLKRQFIVAALQRNGGNQCKAARELGKHRNTLSRDLAQMNLNARQVCGKKPGYVQRYGGARRARVA
jgi:Fis family transcriptional regulator, factor for inversion stimulation protein